MMASDVSSIAPDFIRFLFSTKPKFDCYFIVGNRSQWEPERIGAVKLMLEAHSEVFRLELEDSELAEKNDVPVEDVHPDTFKGMLKYVYGHDTTSELCFDDADNMLYLAEKYMMHRLKDKLAVRLMELLNTDNIFSLLNNPACFKHLELDSAITEILKFETDCILESPQFVEMSAECFLKILEQNELAVPEIELWRAAIKWAKHRANTEDGLALRQQITRFNKHLRLCTLTGDEICEVATPDVLTSNEIGTVCQSVGRKRKPDDLNDFSDEIVPRKKLKVTMKPNIKCVFGSSLQKQYELKLTNGCTGQVNTTEYNFTIYTKQSSVELLPLTCWFKDCYSIDCTTTITKSVPVFGSSNNEGPVFGSSNNEGPVFGSSNNEDPITIRSRANMNFEVPLSVKEQNVILLSNTKYAFKVTLMGSHMNWQHCNTTSFTNDHLTLDIHRQGLFGYYCFPSEKLLYRVDVRSQGKPTTEETTSKEINTLNG